MDILAQSNDATTDFRILILRYGQLKMACLNNIAESVSYSLLNNSSNTILAW